MKRWFVLSMLAVFLWAPLAHAVNDIYWDRGTSKLFADSAQSEDVTITLSALASGAGRYSARYDKGSGSQPTKFSWECHLQLTGTNVVGEVVEFYVALSDGTNAQGALGTSDAALATDKRKNLTLIGVLVVDQTTTNTTMVAHGTVDIYTRYFSLGVWNATALALKTDTAVHGCTFTPVFPEIQ